MSTEKTESNSSESSEIGAVVSLSARALPGALISMRAA